MFDDSPIHAAAHADDAEALRRLLGDDPSVAHLRGWMDSTPLHAAAAGGAVHAVRLLLAAGADPLAARERGDVALHWATSAAVTNALLDAGPSALDLADFSQRTPLHWSSAAGAGDVVGVLLAHGAAVMRRSSLRQTPLHEARTAGVVDLLVEAGADVKAGDRYGFTPLHQAVRSGLPEVTAALLRAGADPRTRDDAGRTAVHLARSHRQAECLAHLEASLPNRPQPLAEPVGSGDAAAWPQHSLRLDPARRRAYTVVGHASLAAWSLDDVRSPAQLERTEHARYASLALSPDGELLLALARRVPPEVRRAESLALMQVLDLPPCTAAAFSPDGRRLAVATESEQVLLLDLQTQAVTAEVGGGEWTGSLAFSPDGTVLAAACSFQGGCSVRVDRVTAAGDLVPLLDIERAQTGDPTPAERFVDTLSCVRFLPDGTRLLLWESSAIYQELRPDGWRGDVVCVDVTDGTVFWQVSVDAAVTGRATSLAQAGFPMGYFAEVSVVDGNRQVAVGVDRAVVLLDALTGAVRSVFPVDGAVHSVEPDPGAGWLLVAATTGLSRVRF